MCNVYERTFLVSRAGKVYISYLSASGILLSILKTQQSGRVYISELILLLKVSYLTLSYKILLRDINVKLLNGSPNVYSLFYPLCNV